MLFRKTILSLGTYYSPDGEIRVTPKRLKHWHEAFLAMTHLGLMVPSCMDHQPGNDQPVDFAGDFGGDWDAARSAANAVGWLHSFEPTPDGQAAEIVLDLLDPKAISLAKNNTVKVSSVIGDCSIAGRSFEDCITHVDLVLHPVDHEQTPFTFEREDRMDIPQFMKNRKINRQRRERKMALATSPSGGDQDEIINEIVDLLPAFGVGLPPGTTADNIVDRLHCALVAAKSWQEKMEADQAAADGLDDDDGEMDDAGFSYSGGGKPRENEQNPHAMSLRPATEAKAEATAARFFRKPRPKRTADDDLIDDFFRKRAR